MAVPGHDERDFAFAQRFGLPIRRVIAGPDDADDAPLAEAYVDQERIGAARGQRSATAACHGPRASRRIVADLEARGEGSATVTYRIRDWLVSRQRAWGTPIPVVYCERATAASCRCRRTQLPVLLPEDFQYRAGRRQSPRDDGLVPADDVPHVRRRRRGARRTRWTRSWTAPGTGGATCRPTATTSPIDCRGRGTLVPGRPVHGRRRARGHAPAVQPLLREGARRPRHRGRARAVQAALQPGPDPGRRRRADEQEPRQRPGPRRAGDALRRRFGAPVPDVHGSLGPGRPLEPVRASRACIASCAASGRSRSTRTGARRATAARCPRVEDLAAAERLLRVGGPSGAPGRDRGPRRASAGTRSSPSSWS